MTDRLDGELSVDAMRRRIKKLRDVVIPHVEGPAKDAMSSQLRRWEAWLAKGPPYKMSDPLPPDPKTDHE